MNLLEPIYFANLHMGMVAIPMFLAGLVGWIYITGLSFFFFGQIRKKNIDPDEFESFLVKKEFPKHLDSSVLNFYAHFLFRKSRKSKERFEEEAEMFRLYYEQIILQKLLSIKVMAMITPLLGLLGTVNGIINIFSVMTQSSVTNPVVLSDGISEALLTTETGLVLAIPFVFMHSIIKAYHHRLTAKMDSLEERVYQQVFKKDGGRWGDGVL